MAYTKSSVTDNGRGKNLTGFEYSHQHSNTAAEVPAAADLRLGELAVNSADGSLYYKTTGGAVAKVGDAPVNGIVYGRKDSSWVDMTSPANLQVNRGTTSEVAAYTALSGEPVWDTQQKMLFVGDGSTSGGILVGYPVITGVTPSFNVAVNSSTFVTPMTVSLSPINSVWHVKGYHRIESDDETPASVLVEIHNSSIMSGLFSTRRRNSSAVTLYGTDLSRESLTTVTLPQFINDADDFTVLSFDCIVQATSNPLSFGLRFKSSSNGSFAGYVGLADDRMYARRLA
jgi:hypothetical protein